MTDEPVSPNTPTPATPQPSAPESSNLAGAVDGGTLETPETATTPVAPATPQAATPASPAATTTEPTVSSYAQSVTQKPLDDTLEVQNEGVTHYPKQASVNAASLKAVGFSRRKALLVSAIITLLSMLILTGALFLFARLGRSNNNSQTGGVPTQKLDLGANSTDQTPLNLAGRSLALVVNGNVAVKGSLSLDSGSKSIKIQATGIATDQVITLPNASGTICLSSNNCGYLTPADLNAVNDKFGQITFPASVNSLNSQTGNVTLQGTTNQISVTTNGTTITLAAPQDLNTTAAVVFDSITVTNATADTVTVSTIQQTGVGNDITFDAGTDELVFVANGTTFRFPGGGPGTQTICTTGVTCASGGGQAVLLAPTSVQVDNSSDASIFINDTGGGNLLQLQTAGVNKLLVANNGDVTISSGNLTLTGLGTGPVKASSGALSVGAINLASSEVTGILTSNKGGTGVDSSAATNGQLLIGNGSGLSLATLTAGNGVSVTNGSGSISLATLYGSTANTAVQGNTTLTCPSGTGNLSGGGTIITLGTGGTCGALDTVTTPTFTSATLQGTSSLTLGSTGSATGSILFKGATAASGTITLIGPSNPSNNTITLPNETGTICTTGSVCTGYAAASGSGAYVQFAPSSAQVDSGTNSSVFINKTGASGNIFELQKNGTDVLVVGNSGATTVSSNFAVSGGTTVLTAASSGDALTVNNSTSTGNILVLQDNGTAVLTVADGGATTIKSSVNNTSAFIVRDSSNTQVFNVDTSNNRVAVGSGSSAAKLYVTGSGAVVLKVNVSSANNIAEFSSSSSNVALITQTGTIQAPALDAFSTSLILGGTNATSITLGNTAATVGVVGTTTITGRTTGDALTVNNSTSTGNILVLQDNGSAVFTVADGGAITATQSLTIQGNNALTLGVANSVTGAALFKDSTSSFTGTLVVGGLSQDRTFTLPSQGGTICTDSGNCAGAGTTLQSAYNNSGGGTTPEVILNNGGDTGGIDIQNSFASPITGTLFAVRDGASSGLGNALFGVSDTGATTIQSSSSAAFLIQSNDSVQQTLFKVDGSGNASNLVTNGSFESGTTGWATRGSASGLAQSGAKYLYGTKSLVATGGANGDGVVYTIPSTLSPSTTYNFSVYLQRSSGSGTNVQLYFSYNGASGNDTSCISSSQNVQSSGWNRISCTFTTGSGGTAPTSSNSIAIKQTNATAMTVYYDGVLLVATTNSVPTPYYEATYTFNGYSNSSLVILPANDSANAFQVLSNSGGGNVLNVDTLNSRVSIGSNNINAGSSGPRLQVSSTSNTAPVVTFTQGADTTGPGFSTGAILTLVSSATGTSSTVATFGQGYYNDSSGSQTFATLNPTFNPTASSTASYTGLSVSPVVNFQSGGAGSFAAVNINPTYTVAPSGTNSSLKVNTSLSTAIGIIIQGAASQSADMIQFQDSGGTKLLGLAPVTGGTAFTDSSSQQLLKFDTTNNILKVGDSTGTDTATTILQVDSATAAPTTSLSSRNGGLYYNSTLGKLQFIEGNSVKTFCNTSDLGCGNEGSVTLQSAYNNSSSPAVITTTASGKTITFAAGSTFDSATLFQIQNAASANLFVVDSLNGNGAIKIGGGDVSTNGTPVLLVLDNKSTTDDPTGLEGAMYYNAASKLFRCYSDGVWHSCSTLEIDKRFEVSDEFIGGSPSTSNQIGALGWSFINGSCATATSGFSNSPGMLPTGDRPGVFYSTQAASASSYNMTAYRLGPANSSAAGWIIQPNNTMKAAVAMDSTSVNAWMKVGIMTQASGSCTGAFSAPGTGTPNPADPTVGVWWEAAPGSNANWRYCYGTGSAAVCANSGVAVAASTWARVEIRVNSTSSVTYLINGNSYTVTGITLNTTTATYPSFACLTGENTARTCSIDYYQARGVASSQR